MTVPAAVVTLTGVDTGASGVETSRLCSCWSLPLDAVNSPHQRLIVGKPHELQNSSIFIKQAEVIQIETRCLYDIRTYWCVSLCLTGFGAPVQLSHKSRVLCVWNFMCAACLGTSLVKAAECRRCQDIWHINLAFFSRYSWRDDCHAVCIPAASSCKYAH